MYPEHMEFKLSWGIEIETGGTFDTFHCSCFSGNLMRGNHRGSY